MPQLCATPQTPDASANLNRGVTEMRAEPDFQLQLDGLLWEAPEEDPHCPTGAAAALAMVAFMAFVAGLAVAALLSF